MQQPSTVFASALDAHMQGDFGIAEKGYRTILESAPNDLDALMHLGILLAQTGRPELAEPRLFAALKVAPNDVSVLNNVGRFLMDRDDLDDAETMFRKARARDRHSVVALGHIGLVKARKSDYVAAEKWYREALAVDPSADWIRYNFALLLLGKGEYEEAWPLYESRFSERWTDRSVTAPTLPFPAWQGEPLDGKTIVVWGEQGLGDEIQFVRFAIQLKELGARTVTWVSKAPLTSLFAGIEGIDFISGTSRDVLPPHDYWTLSMSLPYRLGTTLQTISDGGRAYLRASATKLLPSILDKNDRFKVGLVWKGNKGFTNDRNRSLATLDPLLSLADIERVQLFSLQKGEAEDDARSAAESGKIVPLGEIIENFADTAHVIDQLDLVITVDTAVAHLAGALGKPVWVILPAIGTDWRWLHRGDTSRWYGSMKLFRQSGTAKDWTKVIQQMRVQLQAKVNAATALGNM